MTFLEKEAVSENDEDLVKNTDDVAQTDWADVKELLTQDELIDILELVTKDDVIEKNDLDAHEALIANDELDANDELIWLVVRKKRTEDVCAYDAVNNTEPVNGNPPPSDNVEPEIITDDV